MLALLLREPFCGPMTPEIFADTPDWVVVRCHFAPRDKRGRLVPWREGNGRKKRLSRRARWARNLARAGRDLPSPESLKVPAEVLAGRVYREAPHFVAMFWNVWASRGLTAEQTMAKWKESGNA